MGSPFLFLVHEEKVESAEAESWRDGSVFWNYSDIDIRRSKQKHIKNINLIFIFYYNNLRISKPHKSRIPAARSRTPVASEFGVTFLDY